MRKLIGLLVACTSVLLLAPAGCTSDKNSQEACLHQTSMDLDKGNYDKVLGSACADSTQVGAAWFGKAGYDIANVLNRFVDANSSSSDSTTTQKSDLNIYMTQLTSNVTGSTLTYLDNAKTAYTNAETEFNGTETAKDAQFYVSIVDAVKSLSLIKVVLPNIISPDGTLNTACDYNANKVPDDADATACALITAANLDSSPTGTLSCNGATPSAPTPVSFIDSTVTGTFSGLIITMSSGTGDTSGCVLSVSSDPAMNTYKRLLYQDPATLQWFVATTTSDTCTDQSGNTWPCPVGSVGDANLDLTTAIDTSIHEAVSSLSSSLTTTTSTDVQTSINKFEFEACQTPCSSVNGCTWTGSSWIGSCPYSCGACDPATTDCSLATYCSSVDISNYIQNNLH